MAAFLPLAWRNRDAQAKPQEGIPNGMVQFVAQAILTVVFLAGSVSITALVLSGGAA